MADRVMPPRYKHHIRAVADKYGMSIDRVLNFGRGGTILVAARMELCWRLAIVEELGWSAVARRLGCDHTTVMYLARKYSTERFGTSQSPGLNHLIKVAFDKARLELMRIRFAEPELEAAA